MPSQQIQGWININDVVAAYLDRSEQGIHKKFKAWQLAFQGMEQLGLDFFYRVASVQLPVNPNMTVNLPGDFLQYTKVGVFNSQGGVVSLIYNPNISSFDEFNPNRVANTTDNTLYNMYTWNSPIFYNWWNGSYYTNMYGIPSGSPFVGTFKVDFNSGVILLDHSFTYPYIVLEYVASPEVDGAYYIPVQFKEALIWFIGWHDISLMPNTRKGGLGDKAYREKQFYNQRRLAWARYKPTYLEQAYETSLLNQRLTVKA